MDEFALIRRYFTRTDQTAGVRVGIGDDGAVLAPGSATELVNVIDTLVEGVHFPTNTRADDLGYRALAVNLSDIAAMGAIPRWMTLALSIPTADESWLASFADGLFEAASAHNVALVGGDTTHADTVVVTIALSGEIERGKALLRSGARPGDAIFVTGTLGDAAAALDSGFSAEADEYLLQRFHRPTPRVDFGRALVGRASAAIDISDGLWADLKKLLDASGVGGNVDIGCLPVSESLAVSYPKSKQHDFALSGGDDYELCFTARPGPFFESTDVRVTAIGTVTERTGLKATLEGNVVSYSDSGYRHFR